MRAVVDAADVIDVVVEVRDARLPRSTAVAHLHKRLAHKAQVAVLNRMDLAEEAATKAWLVDLDKDGRPAFSCVSTRAGTTWSLSV